MIPPFIIREIPYYRSFRDSYKLINEAVKNIKEIHSETAKLADKLIKDLIDLKEEDE